MVVIDSSDSSSDEEDRRLKPIRRRNGSDYYTRARVFDASQTPEDSSSKEIFVGLRKEQNQNSFQVSSQPKINRPRVMRSIFSNHLANADQRILQDTTKEIVAHTRSLENFARQIEQIPSQSLASKKLLTGLKLIKEYVGTVNDVPDSSSNIQSNDVRGHTFSLQETEQYLDESYNPFEGKDFYSLDTSDIMTKKKQGKVIVQMKEASCQTNISGDVIPREATAALEFFQELIKNS